jgi:enoyl-[acyl-carrier-protein] reductase (NADH)
MKQRLLKTVSLRRMVTAEDVAETALFVCSPAGASVTGQALSVCGDHQVLQ